MERRSNEVITSLKISTMSHRYWFARTENSWHGHKPFTGERRVIQITWLQSQKEYDRKLKRGRFSYFLKRLMPWTSGGY